MRQGAWASHRVEFDSFVPKTGLKSREELNIGTHPTTTACGARKHASIETECRWPSTLYFVLDGILVRYVRKLPP